MFNLNVFRLFGIIIALSIIFTSSVTADRARTALDEYVERFDPEYSWVILNEYPDKGLGYSSYLINMTSQKWKTEVETSQSIWYHYLIVVVPTVLRFTDSAFLIVDNGRFTDSVPTPSTDGRFNSTADYALQMGAVAADLKLVPNQNIHVQGDPENKLRGEDDLIAWTFRRFLDDISDPDILLYLPMVKATVRAMDTVQAFLPAAEGLNIESFMVEGGSKRGWTAYLTAAVDRRVFALVPEVLSCLNFVKVMRHQFEAYGGWSFSNIDYYNEDIMVYIDEPEMQKMCDIIDPHVYFDRLTMPKLLISATGDEHFMPDDSWYFWDDFVGEKYIWLIENSGHNIASSPQGSRIRPNLAAFFIAVKESFSLPQMTWTKEETSTGGSITVWTDTTPIEIVAVYADTKDALRRDFRRNIGIPDPSQPVPSNIEWFESPTVEMLDVGHFKVEFTYPEEGWRCFFIKMRFEGPDGKPLYLTTEVNIIPDTFPFPPCVGAECKGTLL